MNSLIIQPTENTPKIVFDPENDIYEISGESRPENVREFYEPVLNWLRDLGNDIVANKAAYKSKTMAFEFKLDYFNSSSSKFILDILKKIKEFHTNGADVVIQWYVDEGDEDMQEAGEEMSKMVKLPFEYIEKID